jgi:cytoskeleton protein RodZ
MVPAVAEEPAPVQAVEQAEAPALLPEGLHHVEVIADGGECWMGFEPDGRKQQRFLRKGDSFTMSFRDSLEVKLGNVSAVRVIYDGKELERSNSQRVMTLRFPPAE